MASVIRSFADRGTEDVFDGLSSKEARAVCPMVCFRWKEGYADDVEVTDYH